jgi:hypothetical protein
MTRLLALVWPDLRTDAEIASAVDFNAMLDRLDDLSPRVEAVDRGVALVDVTGLGPSLGDEPRIAARAVALVRKVAPLPVRAGIGDNRWLAVLAARLARLSRPEAPAAFHAFPAGAVAVRHAMAALPLILLPAEPETRQRLALFGLTTLGELAGLPRSAVGAQFGQEGERLQALARGEDPRPLIPRRRPERLVTRATFEPPVDGVGGAALALRRCCAELCDRLRARHLAPGRATLTLELDGAPRLAIELAFPEPALEPDWIARLLLTRLDAIGLVFDRLSDPASRQLATFTAQAARWEELRWELERLNARFGEGRLWRARMDRPAAALPERQARLAEVKA